MPALVIPFWRCWYFCFISPTSCRLLHLGNRGTYWKDNGAPMVYNLLDRLPVAEDGQGLAEYALILALIAIVATIALLFLGGQVSGILSNVGNSV